MLLLASGLVHAQKSGQEEIDSMLSVLPNEKDVIKKSDLLSRISNDYRLINPDEGLRYAQMGLDLAMQINDSKDIARCYSSLGINYQYKSDYPNAFDYALKALKKYEETGDKRGMANAYRNIGTIYQYEKNYPKVLEYDLKALKIFEDMGDKQGVASNLTNIGIFYFSQKEYDKALDYNFRALKIGEELYRYYGGENLSNIGDVYMHMNDYAKALEYDFKALKRFAEAGDKYGTAIALGNTGEAYLAAAKAMPGKITQGGEAAANKSANLNRAIEYLGKAIEESRKINQLDNIIEFSQYLSEAYELDENYKDALKNYKEYATMNDSVYSSQNDFRIKQAEHQHDLDLKDRDIKLAHLAVAKKQNEQVFLFAGIALLSLVVLIVLRNSNTQRKTNKLLSTEKKRSDDLLLNILPSEVADELKEKGTAAAKYFDNVTVMFTDFVDFTKAGEKMSPQQLVDELHACFKAFDEIIRKYDIEKIKTVGDAYLAVSGLPLSNTDHAAIMVSAATEIMDFMKERKAVMGDKTFEVRIGIHSGNVVAGIVGVIKFAYDIWGDTVNTAARMEEHSEAGKINISQTTFDLVKNMFNCTYRGEITAKNKGEMSMYFVENKV